MDSWNGLDFLIFLIFAVNTILGMVRGATKELISMMCLCAALIFMIKFTVPLAAIFNGSPLITEVVESQVVQNFMLAIGAGPMTSALLKQLFFCISLLLLFVGIFSICEAALSRRGFVEVFTFPYSTLNRKVGAALGCTRGYVLVLIFLLCLVHIYSSSEQPGSDILSGSFFARLFEGSEKRLDSLITGQQPSKYREIFKDKNLYNSGEVIKNLDGGSEKFPQPVQPVHPEQTPQPEQVTQPSQTFHQSQAELDQGTV